MKNDTIRLSNELSVSNLRNLGFAMNSETKEYQYLCQDKYYKYATKKTWVCVSNALDKVYIYSVVKEYKDDESCISDNDFTTHLNIHTTSELIFIMRALTRI